MSTALAKRFFHSVISKEQYSLQNVFRKLTRTNPNTIVQLVNMNNLSQSSKLIEVYFIPQKFKKINFKFIILENTRKIVL